MFLKLYYNPIYKEGFEVAKDNFKDIDESTIKYKIKTKKRNV